LKPAPKGKARAKQRAGAVPAAAEAGASEAPGAEEAAKPVKRRRKKAPAQDGDAKDAAAPQPQPVVLAAPGILARKWVRHVLCRGYTGFTLESSPA